MDTKENIETVEKGEIKAGRNWKESKVIFIVLPIILTVLIPLGGLPYLCGRLNYHLSLICIFYPIVLGFIVYCLVRGIGIFFRDWRQIHVKKNCYRLPNWHTYSVLCTVYHTFLSSYRIWFALPCSGIQLRFQRSNKK